MTFYSTAFKLSFALPNILSLCVFLTLPERDPKVFITFEDDVYAMHLYISCTAQHKNNEEENSQEDEEPDRGGEQPGDACHGGKGGRLFGNPAGMVVIVVRRALNNLHSF